MPFEPGAQPSDDRGRALLLGGNGDMAHFPQGPMMPVAIGTIGYCFELSATELGLWAAYASVSGPGWAATRLLGLDPFAVGRCLAQLSGEVEAVASGAVASSTSLADLPAGSAPLVEMGAEAHEKWEVRLFAS
jgi:urease accessory protein